MRKTNPISRLRIADCGLGTDLRRDAGPVACCLRPAEGKMRKTNPIPGGAGWGRGHRGVARGEDMRNEPNLRRVSSVKRQMLSWASRAGSPLGGSYFKLYTSNFRGNADCPGQIAQNEANFTRAPGNGRRRPGPGAPNAQKMQNEPNLLIADFGLRIGHRPVARRRNVQNEPNSSVGRGSREQKMQNEPNWARPYPPTGWHGAEQSQFPPVRQTRGIWNRQLRAERGDPPPYAGPTPRVRPQDNPVAWAAVVE